MSTNDCYENPLSPDPREGGGGASDPGLGSAQSPLPNGTPPLGPDGTPVKPGPYLPPGYTGPSGSGGTGSGSGGSGGGNGGGSGGDADPILNPDEQDPRRYSIYRETLTGRLDDTELQRDSFIFNRRQKVRDKQTLDELLKERKLHSKKKNECKEKASKKGKKKPKKKFCICPTCNPLNKVLDKISGKNFFTIPFTNFKVPRLDHLLEKTPTFDQNRREGEACGACEGTKKVTDATDDSAKYQQVAQQVEQKAPQIMEQEAKLGLGGARTTFIQGNDTLFVGLGFNNNQTYEVMADSNIAPTMKGGKIPQQNSTKVNTVVGKQGSIAWPQSVGTYSIKCANKFNVMAGAGGITLATQGPLTFSAGITKFVGPQISIGCASGPLTLEGNSVNVSGKTIALTPTGGEVFVKGSISNTANITCQGHAHFESVSFPKGSCVGVTKSTYNGLANPDVFQTASAAWGAAALKGATTELKGFYQAVPMDSKSSAFRTQSPSETANIGNRTKSIAKLSPPWEAVVTGYILPGTSIKMVGTSPCNLGGKAGGEISGTTTALIPIHNIPHSHGIPEMMHKHEILLPDMDYTADSAQSLRDKTLNSTHESGVPADPTKDTQTRTNEVRRTAVELKSAKQVQSTSTSNRAGMLA